MVRQREFFETYFVNMTGDSQLGRLPFIYAGVDDRDRYQNRNVRRSLQHNFRAGNRADEVAPV